MLPHARFADAADCPRGPCAAALPRRRLLVHGAPPAARFASIAASPRLHRAFTDTNVRSLPR